MKHLSSFALLFFCIAGFGFGWYFGRKSIPTPKSEIEIIHDTIQIVEPQAQISEATEKEIPARLPLVPQPSDKAVEDTAAPRLPADSATVRIPIRRYTFDKPGTYHIEALGYNVTLPKVEVYKTSTTITRTQIQRPRWEVSLTAGIDECNQWIGIEAERSFGRIRVSAIAGWDPSLDKAIIGARVNLTLFRR